MKSSHERYTNQGLKLFACWLPEELVTKIRIEALNKGMRVADLIACKFKGEDYGQKGTQTKSHKSPKILVKSKNNK